MKKKNGRKENEKISDDARVSEFCVTKNNKCQIKKKKYSAMSESLNFVSKRLKLKIKMLLYFYKLKFKK